MAKLNATHHDIREGDCLDLMRGMEDDSVDLVFTSPPYGDARSYGIDVRESQSELMQRRIAETT